MCIATESKARQAGAKGCGKRANSGFVIIGGIPLLIGFLAGGGFIATDVMVHSSGHQVAAQAPKPAAQRQRSSRLQAKQPVAQRPIPLRKLGHQISFIDH